VTEHASTLTRLLLSARDTAAALGVCERTLWERTRTGEIPCVRIGRRVLYEPRDLEAWIAQQKRQAAAPAALAETRTP